MASIQRLTLIGLRNLASLELTCDNTAPVLITGANGAGKTAILEGIHLLASGRSFRESRLQRLQQWQADQVTLFAQVNNRQGSQQLGWQRHKSETRLRLNGENARTQAELAWHLPVQVFSPESHDLLIHGSTERRRFLDWGAFYQHPQFLLAWRHYQHALRQRNHALRQQAPDKEVALWHAPLWQAAEQVDAARQSYCRALSATVAAFAPQISDSLNDISLSYHRGWREDESLPDIWAQQIEHDRQLGYTQAGPHRADLKLRSQGRDALSIFSRGQQKLLALTLMLSQAKLLSESINESPILLLDDLPAELDATHRQRVLAVLPQLNAQVFLTATDANSLPLNAMGQHWQLNEGRLG
jgi:DNA replication and repair protein RecF